MSWGKQGPCTQELQTPPSPGSALAHHTCPTLAPPSFPNTRKARLLPAVVLVISVRSWGLSWWHLTGRLPLPESPVLLTDPFPPVFVYFPVASSLFLSFQLSHTIALSPLPLWALTNTKT